MHHQNTYNILNEIFGSLFGIHPHVALSLPGAEQALEQGLIHMVSLTSQIDAPERVFITHKGIRALNEDRRGLPIDLRRLIFKRAEEASKRAAAYQITEETIHWVIEDWRHSWNMFLCDLGEARRRDFLTALQSPDIEVRVERNETSGTVYVMASGRTSWGADWVDRDILTIVGGEEFGPAAQALAEAVVDGWCEMQSAIQQSWVS